MHNLKIAPTLSQILKRQTPVAMFSGWLAAQQNGGNGKQRSL